MSVRTPSPSFHTRRICLGSPHGLSSRKALPCPVVTSRRMLLSPGYSWADWNAPSGRVSIPFPTHPGVPASGPRAFRATQLFSPHPGLPRPHRALQIVEGSSGSQGTRSAPRLCPNPGRASRALRQLVSLAEWASTCDILRCMRYFSWREACEHRRGLRLTSSGWLRKGQPDAALDVTSELVSQTTRPKVAGVLIELDFLCTRCR